MYRIKDNVNLNILREFGFKIGREYPDNERCICNDRDRDDFWLIPIDPEDQHKILYADDDFDQPVWSVHVQPTRRLWIDCVPSCTYHIDNMDMDFMFYTLMNMILSGIVEDDYQQNN